MKIVVLSLAMLLSANAFAASFVFNKGSVVPAHIQATIAKRVQEECPAIGYNKYLTVEEDKSESLNPQDTMNGHSFFSSLFKVYGYDEDGHHPVEQFEMNVETMGGKVLKIDSEYCTYKGD